MHGMAFVYYQSVDKQARTHADYDTVTDDNHLEYVLLWAETTSESKRPNGRNDEEHNLTCGDQINELLDKTLRRVYKQKHTLIVCFVGWSATVGPSRGFCCPPVE